MTVTAPSAARRLHRSLGRRCSAVVFVALFVALTANPAAAAMQNTPDPTWGVNGRVSAILRLGDRIYLGGNFTRAVPPRHTAGVAVERFNLAAIDAVSGELDVTWDPRTNGPVHTLAASSDGSRIYAGGNFTEVDGTLHKNLVSLDALSGEVDQAWNVNVNYPVWSAATNGSKLHIGGAFTQVTVNGRTWWRTRLAALDQATGSLDMTWKPTAGNTVKAMEVSADGTLIYIGGNFQMVSGQSRRWLAALDVATGAVSSTWVPTTGIWDFSPCGNGCITDIEATSTHVYAAVGGARGNKVMALDASTAALKWEKYGDGDFQAVGVRGNELYAGGHFEHTSRYPGRERFVTFNATTGAVTDYYVYVDSSGGIWSILTEPSRLYLGGDFTKAGPTGAAVPQPGFAQFSDISPPT